MPKGSPELAAARREEIVNACEKLYQTMSFKDITLKEIGNETSFSRPTIYNYFQTKEEIFLSLFQREYERWNNDLEKILARKGNLTREDLAGKIADSLCKRTQLLKLLAMNTYDMEANSREENLVAFKVAYGNSIANVRRILDRFVPDMSSDQKDNLIYVFFPFMFGIYPYTEVTKKQKDAMKAAEIDFKYQTIRKITYNCLMQLL
ncbi:MAG TPA: TetR family transcriptional regulator [Clostridiales bacterium]|nr:TetR family transcriptional regulator [Clostridiales bacterium]